MNYGDYTRFQGRTLLLLALLAAFSLLTAGCASEPAMQPAPQAAEPAPVQSEPTKEVRVAPRAPERYTVKKGDTLWDISSMFLEDPWLWPEIWFVNPQIANPHLIYPGDVIILFYYDDQPQLRVERDGEIYMTTLGTERLSPKIRTSPIDQAIPTIPIEAIRAFLSQPHIVTEDQYEAAPYILRGQDGRLLAGAGDHVYVRGLQSGGPERFNIVRIGDEYEDPETGDFLGWEAMEVAQGVAKRWGDPATVYIERSKRESTKGDRLLPIDEDDFNSNIIPHAPEKSVNGYIIDVVDGVSNVGRYQIVTLNRGEADGLEIGHVLDVYQQGEEVSDDVAGRLSWSVDLPSEKAGSVLVFRVFNEVSFALVMTSTKEIHTLDMVRNP
ncbi:MAG: LysM peptidoglycan-binding domain-containing protein [Gammaproteobacteria bacterium]|nr:LysM peptidoglycan-binding domain-containing protein [Gammaproteobacteria bacterium]